MARSLRGKNRGDVQGHTLLVRPIMWVQRPEGRTANGRPYGVRPTSGISL